MEKKIKFQKFLEFISLPLWIGINVAIIVFNVQRTFIVLISTILIIVGSVILGVWLYLACETRSLHSGVAVPYKTYRRWRALNPDAFYEYSEEPPMHSRTCTYINFYGIHLFQYWYTCLKRDKRKERERECEKTLSLIRGISDDLKRAEAENDAEIARRLKKIQEEKDNTNKKLYNYAV